VCLQLQIERQKVADQAAMNVKSLKQGLVHVGKAGVVARSLAVRPDGGDACGLPDLDAVAPLFLEPRATAAGAPATLVPSLSSYDLRRISVGLAQPG